MLCEAHDPSAMHRRHFVLAGVTALALCGLPRPAKAAVPITVNRDPGCSCCEKWADHLRAAGYTVEIVERDDLDALRTQLGVPTGLAGCHTATADGYVIEGHVPSAAIARLLRERPSAVGIAVAGMPAGSPGMGGAPEPYEVILFGPDNQQSYGRFLGTDGI